MNRVLAIFGSELSRARWRLKSRAGTPPYRFGRAYPRLDESWKLVPLQHGKARNRQSHKQNLGFPPG